MRDGSFSTKVLPEPCSHEELAATVQSAMTLLSATKVNHEEKKHEILMGMVMDKLRGRIGAAKVAEYIMQEMK